MPTVGVEVFVVRQALSVTPGLLNLWTLFPHPFSYSLPHFGLRLCLHALFQSRHDVHTRRRLRRLSLNLNLGRSSTFNCTSSRTAAI